MCSSGSGKRQEQIMKWSWVKKNRSQGQYSTKNGMIKENTQINPNIKGGIERKKGSFGQSHCS
jgi:hypothetical protein